MSKFESWYLSKSLINIRMTQEQLDRALTLSKKINRAKCALDSITDAYKFLEVRVKNSNGCTVDIDTRYLNFDAFKAITLVAIQRELAELEREFEEL